MTIEKIVTPPSSGSGTTIGTPIWAVAAAALLSWGNSPAASTGDVASWTNPEVNIGTSPDVVLGQRDNWIPVPGTIAIRDEFDSGFLRTDDLSPDSKRILGAHAYGRLLRFLTYPEGWAGGEGQRPLPLSLAALDRFLSLSPRFDTEPSVFLTREGFFELVWDTQNGKRIELVFGSAGVSYYFGNDESEGTFPFTNSKFDELLSLVREHQ